MKILVIGTIDNKGGAAQVSWELRRRLKADGHTVTTFARYKYSNEPDVFAIPRHRYQDWLVKLFANDLRFAGTGYIFNTKAYQEADIIHCHNLHSNFFNFKDLERMTREKPVVWTLHDMWAFTGFAYNSYTLRHPNKKRFLRFLWDNTPRLFTQKKKVYENILKYSHLTIVTVSEWLKSEAEKSILCGHPITCIHNGIDSQTFSPKDKNNREEFRKKYGLPLNKKIIGTGIKGWNDAKKLIDSYAGKDDYFFVAIGHDLITTENKNFKVLPRTEDRAVLAEYLNTLNVFFHPTPEDSFGLISAEAMSCGIPVVAYGIDALPEVVSHLNTGYIAKYQDIDDSKKGLEYTLSLSEADYATMSKNARERIVTNFSSEKMYQTYVTLYKKILISSQPKLQKTD